MCSSAVRGAAAAAVLVLTGLLPAQQHLSPKEALELAFPDAAIERTTVVLDQAQQQRLGKLLGSQWQTAVVFPYVATRAGKRVGTGFFDTHRVRGQLETLLIAVGADGAVLRVEVVAFHEPARYQPKPGFYEQFKDRKAEGDKGVAAVEPVAGATLTVQATISATKRILALWRELGGRAEPAPTPGPKPEPAPQPAPSLGKRPAQTRSGGGMP